LPFDIAAYPRKVELSVKMNFIISLDSLTNVIRIVKLEKLHEWGTLGEVRDARKLSLKIVKGGDCLGCKHRRENNIKLDLTEALCECMDWI